MEETHDYDDRRRSWSIILEGPCRNTAIGLGTYKIWAETVAPLIKARWGNRPRIAQPCSVYITYTPENKFKKNVIRIIEHVGSALTRAKIVANPLLLGGSGESVTLYQNAPDIANPFVCIYLAWTEEGGGL